MDGEETEADGKRKAKTTMKIVGIVALLLVTALGFLIAKFYRDQQLTRQRSVQLSEIRMLAIACLSYAHDSGGRFPPTLADIYPNYMDDARFLTTTFTKTGAKEAYIYQTGHSISDPIDTPLIIAPPSPIKNVRAIGYVDGHVMSLRIKPGELPPELSLEEAKPTPDAP